MPCYLINDFKGNISWSCLKGSSDATCTFTSCLNWNVCTHPPYNDKKNNKKKYVMYCQVWWPILEIGPLHLTHPSAHTQQWVMNKHTRCENTHPEQWAAIAPAPGEQLGVRCLAQGHLSHGIEGGESAVHSQSPPSIPAGPEIRTRNLWITSLTL